MSRAIVALLFTIGCVASDYAAALDSCALGNVGNAAAIRACQCQVSQQYGRDCSWLDGGPGGDLDAADGGAQ